MNWEESGEAMQTNRGELEFCTGSGSQYQSEEPHHQRAGFGETSSSVLPRAMAVARGMEDEGVISCIKHFPGHGDTDSDSHKTLPTVKKDRQELDRTELMPFRKAVIHNVHSLMVAHLNMPSLTGEKGLPTSLSHRVVTELLQEEFGFQGLVVTDALNMSGADQQGAAGEIELRAFLAGNDILLFSPGASRRHRKDLLGHKSGQPAPQALGI